MRNFTFFAACLLTISIGSAQISQFIPTALNGGGNTRLSANGDVTGLSDFDRLPEIGISGSNKSLGNLLGLNTIHNGYNGRLPNYKGRRVLTANNRNFINGFLSNDWLKVLVTTPKGSLSAFAKYNALTDQVFLKDDQQIFEMLKQEDLTIDFINQNKSYVVKKHIGSNGVESLSYFVQDKTEKSSSLFRKEDYIMLRDNEEISLFVEDSFFIEIDGQLLVVSTNRKVLRQNYPLKYKTIKKFIKQNNIEDNEEGLRKLGTFIKSM